jgi:hypothetical protein
MIEIELEIHDVKGAIHRMPTMVNGEPDLGSVFDIAVDGTNGAYVVTGVYRRVEPEPKLIAVLHPPQQPGTDFEVVSSIR